MPFRAYIYLALGLLFVIGMVVWIGWGIYIGSQTDELLDKSGQITTGKVLEKSSGYRSRVYATYEFYVDNRKYIDETRYHWDEDVQIGSKYELIYYPPDPTIHRIDFKKPIREPVNVAPLDSLTLDSIFKRSLQRY